MVLESGILQERAERYELTEPLPPLAIPATLHDSLMARLDRLATVKTLAQLGATLGREFSYALLQALSPWDEETLQRGLHQLVEAEFLYQRGLPPHATYLFKHALIQDTAYQSLLKSTRQQYHQRIAQVLVERFPEIVETQPEPLARHYTEAGLSEQALSWWQRAGQRALERSALVEAIAHFTKGLELLDTLPDTPARARQELALRAGLGVPLSAIKGPGAPEVFDNYGRARQLCHDIGEAPEQYQVLWGSWRSHLAIAKLEAAQDLADQLVDLAQREQDSGLLLEAHHAQWTTLSRVYEPPRCWHHAEQGMALYQPERHHRHVFTISDHDAGVCCRGFGALSLWQLGHPDQALTHSRDAVALARWLSHPTSLAHALTHATWLLQLRRDLDPGLERAEEIVAVAAEQGFAQYLATAAILKGWLLTRMGQGDEGLELMRRGLGSGQAKGTGPTTAYFLYLLADAHLLLGEASPGLERLAEALDEINRVGTRAFEPEMHRVQGELLRLFPDGDGAGAEACFQKAINMAQAQNARTLELRAATSLARLWQQQGKHQDAYELLAPGYGWFTEGFDTADLQEAKVLLTELT
jgi:predicted ATPase